MPTHTRRYDLDWLRVILFGILVPYHAAIGFVSYGHKVYGFRNETVAGPLFELAIFFSHSWRLHALFLISGMGTYYALRNRTWLQFILERCLRILLPLIVASFTWNSVAAFYKAVANGFTGSFFAFWLEWLQNPSHFYVWHLWFLENLFIYAIAALPLFWLLRKRKPATGPNFLILSFTLLVIIELLLKPYGPLGFRKTFTFFSYFVFFILGYQCMINGDWFWPWLRRNRWRLLIAATVCFALLANWLGLMTGDLTHMNLVIKGNWLAQDWPFQSMLTAGFTALYVLNSCLWCGAIFAFGTHYLNRDHPWLKLLNQAVYPFYILHMPILFAGLYYLTIDNIYWLTGFLALTVFTYAATAIAYWPIPRSRLLKMLFGLR